MIDEEYKEEMKDEVLLEEEEGIIGNDDPDSQEDYFQNPMQQHNAEVRNNNEPISNIIPRSKRGTIPIVTLSNTTLPTKRQECDKRKKKNVQDKAVSIENELDDTGMPSAEITKVGVHTNDDAVESDDETGDNDSDCNATPRELDSDLGPYWTLAQSTHAYVLNTITSYSNVEASKSTPQYGFNRGLKEFGDLGYEATVKELDDNLLGMRAVKMLKPSELNKTI
jgi:hypothetical protein